MNSYKEAAKGEKLEGLLHLVGTAWNLSSLRSIMHVVQKTEGMTTLKRTYPWPMQVIPEEQREPVNYLPVAKI